MFVCLWSCSSHITDMTLLGRSSTCQLKITNQLVESMQLHTHTFTIKQNNNSFTGLMQEAIRVLNVMLLLLNQTVNG